MRTRWSHYLLLASTQNLFPSSSGLRTIASRLLHRRRDIPENASINQNIPECLPTQFWCRLNFRERYCNAEWIFANYSAQQFRFKASGNSNASFFCKIELHNQILVPFFGVMAPILRYLMIHRLVFLIPGWGLVELCLKTQHRRLLSFCWPLLSQPVRLGGKNPASVPASCCDLLGQSMADLLVRRCSSVRSIPSKSCTA